jgi:hypothetical protein
VRRNDATASSFVVKVRGEVFAHFRLVVEHYSSAELTFMLIKISTFTQLREILYTDFQDMLVLLSTVAARYYNCCTDGSTSSGNYGYQFYFPSPLTLIISIFPCPIYPFTSCRYCMQSRKPISQYLRTSQ